MRLKIWLIVISHTKLQINVWMFVSERKWQSGIKDDPLPSAAVLWVVSVRERNTEKKKLRGECRSEKQYFFHYSSPYFINILNIWESEMDAWKRFICSPKCSSLLSSTYKMKVISLNCMLIKQQFHKCLWY